MQIQADLIYPNNVLVKINPVNVLKRLEFDIVILKPADPMTDIEFNPQQRAAIKALQYLIKYYTKE